jgi:hypothetical protein
MDVHIFWSGPYSLNNLSKLNDEQKHYGVYQIYGHHSLYGSHVLLYIGKAAQQTFGKRISQEEWEFIEDPSNTQIYIGQFAGKKNVSNDEWSEQIELTEKLLIYAHNPIFNNSNTLSIPELKILDLHVFNWSSYRDLLPEVSGKRYTSKFVDITEEKIYKYSGD